jgi:hypothetical protein
MSATQWDRTEKELIDVLIVPGYAWLVTILHTVMYDDKIG